MSTTAKLSVPEYEQIVASGVFDGMNNRHIELIWGELIEMGNVARISVPEYERIIATGVFDGKNKRRIELIRGELREMTPIGSTHAMILNRLNHWSFEIGASEQAWIRVQDPVAFLPIETEPEPDLVWAVLKDYTDRNPEAADVLLLVEVADSSLRYDRGEKSEIYAAAGIKEYWLVDVNGHAIEVMRDPHDGQYRCRKTYGAGETVSPLALPRAELNVDSLFPSRK
jgi:Uma2 family endonuclease